LPKEITNWIKWFVIAYIIFEVEFSRREQKILEAFFKGGKIIL
jgi:hypothetical protein